MSPQQLAYRAAHHTPWYERIGDGGAMAWTITAGYFVAAILCVWAARRLRDNARPERMLWLAAGAALLALGINKQLDLQVALVEVWRDLALAQGWYGARRTVQLVVFGAGLVAAGLGATRLVPILRRQGTALILAYLGLAMVGTYVALRAAQFQHVFASGAILQHGPGWLALLELSGIGVTACAAWRQAARPR